MFPRVILQFIIYKSFPLQLMKPSSLFSPEFVIDIDNYGLEKGKYYFIITGTADARGSVKFTFYDE